MEGASPKVSIIIPHYNHVECLKRLLPSIANQTFHDYEVIIIDDFTPDRSAPVYIRSLIKDYPKMRLVENNENMGFIKTVNRGIGLSNAEYICLLNQDTEVKESFVKKNVEILDADASIAGLSCVIVDKYGKNWWTGGSLQGGFPVNLRDDFEGIRRVDFVAGTAAFYSKEVFDKIGLFDECYRMYHEDVEFGLRIRAKADYKTCVFSHKLVVHHTVLSMPTPELDYYLARNQILVVRTYFPQLLTRVIVKYLRDADIVRTLTKDILGLHPWLFFVHLLRFRPTFRGVFAGLRQKPSRRHRLVEE